ncbi:2-methylisocitrate lyase-like PEP mutase family enzyme [Sphingobium boeckii]|uniref:2-methylisocitrate lyase-like PEP mutase family enzyme n=2 Tax=Sphingobium boeckii TaxID=1082345 RepID=A0A7W9AL67_9SPHN|nr:2-methylisocitrate lyase-like PEP mutase family enzyme [Sphingobium boeckii]
MNEHVAAGAARLKSRLAQGDFFVAPGVQDMIAALIADRVGFDTIYGTGYWLTASAYGMPDAGLVSYTQMVDRMRTVTRTSKAALIADADTGFGGLLNVHHTVRGYEEAGVAAIQIEDQEFPKKCGHSPGKRIVPMADMVAKIKVAVDTRDEMLIIARTDARQSEGMDGVMRRLDAYAAAGADVLFPETLSGEAEMRQACEGFAQPVMVNMANGGLSPMMPAKALEAIGFAFAIFPSLTSLAAAHAMETALIRLRDEGDGAAADIPLFDFATFGRLIGMEGVRGFEQKWALEEGNDQ